MPVNPLLLKSLAGEYYGENEGARLVLENVEEPELREWALTKHVKGDELTFVRKLEVREVEGFIELYHSLGRFKEPKEWRELLGYDLVIDVDYDGELDREALGEMLQVASEIALMLSDFIGAKPTVNFSGSKGFHVRWYYEDASDFFDFDRIRGKKATSVDQVIESLSYLLSTVIPEEYRKYVDLNIYQRNRLIRALYSINAKTGLPAVPLPEYLYEDPPERRDEAAEEVLSVIRDLSEYTDAAERVGFDWESVL